MSTMWNHVHPEVTWKEVYPKNLCEKWWRGGSRAWKPQGQTDQSICGGRTEIGGKMMFGVWI